MSLKLAQFLHQERHQSVHIALNVPEVRQSVDEIICLLFPERGCLGLREAEDIQTHVAHLEKRFIQYFEGVSPLKPDLKSHAAAQAKSFLDQLISIAQTLDTDAQAAFAGDPAAYNKEEVIISYPGFYAVCVYRLANALYRLDIPLLPRIMSEYAHEKTGIDIHPGATIGASFFIDHGTGVVIGETSHIGTNVKIYQGVTLGALSVKKKLQSKKRHPTIEDDVVIYANSTILGGETVVGKGSVIGGNVWLTESVPSGSVILNKLEVTGK